ncbi:MAG: hypothetical protein ACXAC7_17260 [Candidatus Hodarchaeales archaeon]|jgi:hypothetical protein
MQKILDINPIQHRIPKNPSREWIWTRILIKIDYSRLKPVTSLQWMVLAILNEFGEDSPDIEVVAKKLGINSSIVEEILLNLTSLGALKIKLSQDTSQLANYEFNHFIKQNFEKFESIQETPSNQKFILFHDQEDKKYYYQMVERVVLNKNKEKIKEKKPLNFDNVLLAVIEQIWDDLEHDPHSLIGEKEFQLTNQDLINNSDYMVSKIEVNFL